MAKYRKKPVVIEAEQWNPIRDGYHYIPIPPVCSSRLVERRTWLDVLLGRPANWYIRTLEGDMKITPGDYIIRGVKGELYACKPDIFKATYEPVEAAGGAKP